MLNSQTIVIGTRGSALALAQTNWIAGQLRLQYPDLEIKIRTIQTQGDATQAANIPLSSFGEKGIFAKELEAALLAGEIDLAVHSMKDLAHTLPVGLALAAVPLREDSRDALIGSTLDALPQGARVGTGSVRRRALLLSKRPDLQLQEIRGNIDTRLRKWREGEYDAICLAVAGLNRLGLQENIAEILDPEWFIPDPGQGALGLETRVEDRRIWDIVRSLNDQPSETTTRAERAFLQAVGGSCKTPIGASASYTQSPDTHGLHIAAMLAGPKGLIYRTEETGSREAPEELGRQVAQKLQRQTNSTSVE